MARDKVGVEELEQLTRQARGTRRQPGLLGRAPAPPAPPRRARAAAAARRRRPRPPLPLPPPPRTPRPRRRRRAAGRRRAPRAPARGMRAPAAVALIGRGSTTVHGTPRRKASSNDVPPAPPATSSTPAPERSRSIPYVSTSQLTKCWWRAALFGRTWLPECFHWTMGTSAAGASAGSQMTAASAPPNRPRRPPPPPRSRSAATPCRPAALRKGEGAVHAGCLELYGELRNGAAVRWPSRPSRCTPTPGRRPRRARRSEALLSVTVFGTTVSSTVQRKSGCLPGLSGVRMALGCGAALGAALGLPRGSMDASGGCVAATLPATRRREPRSANRRTALCADNESAGEMPTYEAQRALRPPRAQSRRVGSRTSGASGSATSRRGAARSTTRRVTRNHPRR